MEMSNKISTASSKKIKIKKNASGISTKIIKIKSKKTPDEINAITKMLSNCHIDESSKKIMKLSKSLNKFVPLDLTPPKELTPLSESHYGIIPVYVDLDKAERNWIKNTNENNISTLYYIVTRFLVSKISPISINIYPHSDNQFSMEELIEEKYGFTSNEILLINKIEEVVHNLDIYLVFVRKYQFYIKGYYWRNYIELYNHIQEAYYNTQSLSNIFKDDSNEYNYEENPYRSIIANQMVKEGHIRETLVKVLGDGFETTPFKLACLYQSIMDNYQELVDLKK